jgi:short-subunit dehydrogenase
VSLPSGNVLITGATGGIGHAIARAFAARGATLTLTGRRADVLEPLASELGARAFSCDLSDRNALDRLIAECADVDVLVANAAVPASGALLELGQEEIDRMLEVNLRAPLTIARGLAPGMAARGQGHMVFVSSASGKAAAPASSIYSATKFGLRGFALGIREDLRKHGVGASVVLPGFIRDAGMFADTAVELPRSARLLGGTRTPEDVAAAVIRAIERNRAELDVAPIGMRVGTTFASVAPQLSAAITRRMGADAVAASIAEAQRDKR